MSVKTFVQQCLNFLASQKRSNRHVLSTDTTRAGRSQSISQTDTTSQNNARDTTTTQGNIFDAKSQTNEPINIESTDKNGYETNLIKRIGSNAWVVTGFKKPKDGYGQGHGKTIPTEHQSYSARTYVGASDKASDDDMAKSKDLTIPTHIKPTLHRYIKKAFKTFESLDCLVIDMGGIWWAQ